LSNNIWLSFNAAERKYFGNPTAIDIIKNAYGFYSDFLITVTAFD
jgi:hypothetical protein